MSRTYRTHARSLMSSPHLVLRLAQRGSKLAGTVRTGLLKKRDRRMVRVEGELVLQTASLVGSQVVVG